MNETTNEPTAEIQGGSALPLRIASFLLCATTALGSAARSSASAPSQEPADVRMSDSADAWTAKVEAAIDSAGAHPDAVARALVALGQRAIPAIFAMFVAEGPPAASAELLLDDVGLTLESAGLVLDTAPRRRTGLLRALERAPFVDLRAHLESLVLRAPPVATRRAALEVLGVCGSAQELELSIRFASPAEGAAADSTLLAELIERVSALLDRDASGFPHLEKLLPAAEPDVRDALARALARTGSSEALAVFARLLDRAPALKLLLLCHIGPLADRAVHPVDEHVLATVRRFVVDHDREALLEAEIAAGKLEDFEAVPALIELLEHPVRGVRANALWSLERITGLRLKENPERWRAWHETEKEWWRSASTRVFGDLRSDDAARRKTALAEVAGQHLHRHALADAVAPLLGSEDTSVVVLACTTLRYLKSPVAVPALVPCLAHADPTVRHQAWSALKTITREDHPADPEAWASHLIAR